MERTKKTLEERLGAYANKLEKAIAKERKVLKGLDVTANSGRPEMVGLRDFHLQKLRSNRSVAETFYEHFPEYRLYNSETYSNPKRRANYW